MDITPELQASMDRFEEAIQRTKLKLDAAIPPDQQERISQKYEEFKASFSDPEIRNLICRAIVESSLFKR